MSRSWEVGELKDLLLRLLGSTIKNYKAPDSKSTRLLKLNEDFVDVNKRIEQSGVVSVSETKVRAEVWNNDTLLEDCNFTEDDLIVIETKYSPYIGKAKYIIEPVDYSVNREKFGKDDDVVEGGKVMSVAELRELDIKECLKKSGNHGRTGLSNLGNTCFMNSGL